MSTEDSTTPRPRRGLTGKRQAILDGALTVFARDGYTRASVDAISSGAGVSTRTIYNHFTDKAELFRVVIQESARQAADIQVAIIDRHLRKVTDVESDLIDFGRDWVTPRPDSAVHFALVRQINAEADHIPQEAVDTWQETGPRRVRRELAAHLRRLAGRGMLRIDDPDRAALHLLLLISAGLPTPHTTLSDEEITETVTAGVHAFLYGHLHRISTPGHE
ncbi:TetR family transcriptional regulator [Spongiactinospora rosea]|uniref:TetR family transcriptional regulator n=1 Tax=Spongiactinospora rosea TaxID=2248750 RepID=A0A366LSN9_9ACTN|nr:TetR/AcrR family transcriptional regulator [Spongiactinospora rosea]RBQ16767.1 TetR family transcriptional regulator [Spongiactinospora rosea]